jgi:transcriptional regulator with XRE-family HTH domain
MGTVKKKTKRTTNGVEILHKRYIGSDSGRKTLLEKERVNAEVAQLIYDLRTQAGMTQKALADRIGTTQSVISRLEDADYEGHSLDMLTRIADALNQRVILQVGSKDTVQSSFQWLAEEVLNRRTELIRSLFPEVLRRLRQEQHLSARLLAKKLGVDRNEIFAWERRDDYRPTASVLSKLSDVFNIPSENLCMLAVPNNWGEFLKEVSKLAAKLEGSSIVTAKRQRSLDEFIQFLRSMPGGSFEGGPCRLVPFHKGE